jgi:hypothetical protein
MKSVAMIMLLAGCLVFRNAAAQGNDAFQRKGFVFGISAGAGYMHTSIPTNKNSGQAGMAYNWKVGSSLNSRLAILLQGAITTYQYQGHEDSPRARLRGFEGLIPSAQYWVSDRVWVTGGIGLGMDTPVFYDVKDEREGKYYGGGVKTILGTGYEIWQRKNKTIDIQGRLSYGTAQVPEGKRSSFACDVLIGFNLY